MTSPPTKLVKLIQLSLLLLTSLILVNHNVIITAQRSIRHWKRDLEIRLKFYEGRRNDVQNIIASSIYNPGRGAPIAGGVRVSSNGNVRFSELIIPTGSLILESHIAKPTVKTLVDKTQSYVASKARELTALQYQLNSINLQLQNGTNDYIYKSLRGIPQPQYNYSSIIKGTRVFKQVQSAQLIDTRNLTLAQINRTDVNRVIDETYLRKTKVSGLVDHEGRLFFEGSKTFLNTVFARSLISGCCDRLKPLHTNRMMLRSQDQDVLAPIVLQPKNNFTGYGQIPIRIRSLETAQLVNQVFRLGGPAQYPNVPGPIGLNLYSPPENIIRKADLINLHQPDQQKLLKTLVFKGLISIEELNLSTVQNDGKLAIGIGGMGSSRATRMFDLSQDNYLLRFPATRNQSYEQTITGSTFVEGESNFQAGLEAYTVNNVPNFARFLKEVLVRVDRPAVITGPVQFNAVPTMAYYGPRTRQDQSVQASSSQLMFRVHGPTGLQVGQLNNMQLPRDIVILPSRIGMQNAPSLVLKPGEVLHFHGPRRFATQLILDDLVQVTGLINGMQMPQTVVPLHLNDFVSSVGHSDLWFVDGMTVHQLVIQGGRLDDILLRDVFVDAQSLVMQSVFPRQADGSILIRAPLRVLNLRLFARQSALDGASQQQQGLLNGFRPQHVLDLARQPIETIYGRKTFLGPVEAGDCVFAQINSVANWTSHLIRIDRPNTVQAVHSRLAFTGTNQNPNPANNYSSMIIIDHLNVEFHRGNLPMNYVKNWRLSPEFYTMHQALMRHEAGANQTGGRYRCQQIRLLQPNAMVNSIALSDIVTLDRPFRFGSQFTMVGKVELTRATSLQANRIQSNYPIDKLDLVQFNSQRIPIFGSRAPIKLNNLLLAQENRASFVQAKLLNGIPFSEFANSIMSLTRPQQVESQLVFEAPVSFEGPVRTSSSLNGIKNFNKFARQLKSANYLFEDGLQCNAVVLRL